MTQENAAKKLLIVDDSSISRMFIRQYVVEKHPDWIIFEAGSGEEAIDLVEKDVPDYCTMDHNMPGILGIDAAAEILGKHPEMRLVIFTANIQEMHQLLARQIGAMLVKKPVTEKSTVLALNYFTDSE